MEDSKIKRLFIAFAFFILGLALGGGMVVYCSGSGTSGQPAAGETRSGE